MSSDKQFILPLKDLKENSPNLCEDYGIVCQLKELKSLHVHEGHSLHFRDDQSSNGTALMTEMDRIIFWQQPVEKGYWQSFSCSK